MHYLNLQKPAALIFSNQKESSNIEYMNITWSYSILLWTKTSEDQWQQNSLSLQTIWWNMLKLLGTVIKFHTHRRSTSIIHLKKVQGNLMSLLFQFQIGGSWRASSVRESTILQFREESNLFLQEIAWHKIYPAVQGWGGGSHP